MGDLLEWTPGWFVDKVENNKLGNLSNEETLFFIYLRQSYFHASLWIELLYDGFEGLPQVVPSGGADVRMQPGLGVPHAALQAVRIQLEAGVTFPACSRFARQLI